MRGGHSQSPLVRSLQSVRSFEAVDGCSRVTSPRGRVRFLCAFRGWVKVAFPTPRGEAVRCGEERDGAAREPPLTPRGRVAGGARSRHLGLGYLNARRTTRRSCPRRRSPVINWGDGRVCWFGSLKRPSVARGLAPEALKKCACVKRCHESRMELSVGSIHLFLGSFCTSYLRVGKWELFGFHHTCDKMLLCRIHKRLLKTSKVSEENVRHIVLFTQRTSSNNF